MGLHPEKEQGHSVGRVVMGVRQLRETNASASRVGRELGIVADMGVLLGEMGREPRGIRLTDAA
ncbi:hypothetical protein QUA71_17645 [Microcoleus sp. MON1_C5]|uniref:hypothetical protein n=1 Tax=Microcoleus sp. MON1_C5 TaxID=2818828 RepID=UPI002FD1E8EE